MIHTPEQMERIRQGVEVLLELALTVETHGERLRERLLAGWLPSIRPVSDDVFALGVIDPADRRRFDRVCRITHQTFLNDPSGN